MVVIPDKDAVIAITADTGNFPGEMNAIWDHLLPRVLGPGVAKRS